MERRGTEEVRVETEFENWLHVVVVGRNSEMKMMGANGGITGKHLRKLVKGSFGHVECGSGIQGIALDL